MTAASILDDVSERNVASHYQMVLLSGAAAIAFKYPIQLRTEM